MTEIAIVTGAARGIGLATTRRYLDQEMHVGMVDNDVDELRKAAAEFGDRVTVLPFDVSKPDDVEELAAKATSEFGKCNALVNNAGVG